MKIIHILEHPANLQKSEVLDRQYLFDADGVAAWDWVLHGTERGYVVTFGNEFAIEGYFESGIEALAAYDRFRDEAVIRLTQARRERTARTVTVSERVNREGKPYLEIGIGKQSAGIVSEFGGQWRVIIQGIPHDNPFQWAADRWSAIGLVVSAHEEYHAKAGAALERGAA